MAVSLLLAMTLWIVVWLAPVPISEASSRTTTVVSCFIIVISIGLRDGPKSEILDVRYIILYQMSNLLAALDGVGTIRYVPIEQCEVPGE